MRPFAAFELMSVAAQGPEIAALQFSPAPVFWNKTMHVFCLAYTNFTNAVYAVCSWTGVNKEADLSNRGVYTSLFKYIHIDKKNTFLADFIKKLGPFYKKKISPDKIGYKSQISKTKYKDFQNTCQLAYIGFNTSISN